jgi:uncharacterized protein (TIGR03067 family)
VNDGKKVPGEKRKGIVTTIDEDKVVRKRGEELYDSGNIELMPKESPKQFDAKGTGVDGKGPAYKGIYKFEGEGLVICFDPTGKGRPEKFESPAGAGLILITWERIKK